MAPIYNIHPDSESNQGSESEEDDESVEVLNVTGGNQGERSGEALVDQSAGLRDVNPELAAPAMEGPSNRTESIESVESEKLEKQDPTKDDETVSRPTISASDVQLVTVSPSTENWFAQQENEMDVDSALQLFKERNNELNAELLKESYQRYSEHLTNFIQTLASKDCNMAASEVAKHLSELVPEPKHFTTWDADFKQSKLPQILAGLAAVWTMQGAKNTSGSVKCHRPFCVQILCVLRLLSVDMATDGIEKHLAQVESGQGKSLILALVAATLALTRHKVDIVCYNNFLAERDGNKFSAFYSTFGVQADVTYGTLYQMMEKFIHSEASSHTKGFPQLVEELILNGKQSQSSNAIPVDFSNTVLLFDEVDVFFVDEIFEATYEASAKPMVDGLDLFQLFIWTRKQSGSRVEKSSDMWDFLKSSNINDLNSFLDDTQNYELLTEKCEVKTYSNRSLSIEHFHHMIQRAFSYYSSVSSSTLNSLGQITINEQYPTYRGYTDVFNYLCLKRNAFISEINEIKNYGYLNIPCGSFSFGWLPSNYSLILGATASLTDLNNFEKEVTMKLYGIAKNTVLPTVSGSPIARFDTIADFHLFPKTCLCRSYMFTRANKIVKSNRAILVFFESVHELNPFKSEYGSFFERLNVLTMDSSDKEQIISEVGVARTVTLATREMSRGIDYQPSETVEQNGGLHVIQAFFSVDSKEETQIMGRTARLNNKGTFEFVVCQEGLMSKFYYLQPLKESYRSLIEKLRYPSMTGIAEKMSALEKKKQKHQASMNYMKSFY